MRKCCDFKVLGSLNVSETSGFKQPRKLARGRDYNYFSLKRRGKRKKKKRGKKRKEKKKGRKKKHNTLVI